VRVRNVGTAYKFLSEPNSVAGELYRQMLAEERAALKVCSPRRFGGDDGLRVVLWWCV
jgi:hypothetical protein